MWRFDKWIVLGKVTPYCEFRNFRLDWRALESHIGFQVCNSLGYVNVYMFVRGSIAHSLRVLQLSVLLWHGAPAACDQDLHVLGVGYGCLAPRF